MEAIKNWTVKDYSERLASGDATPGGGAAAAMTAAQGAALLAMTLRVSGVQDEGGKLLIAKLDASRASLLDLATADGAAFAKVMKAFKLPRVTDEQRGARKAAIQAALRSACEPPLSVMKESFSLMKDAVYVVAHSKPNVVSDAAIAVHLLWAAMATARYNVWINLKSIEDEDYRPTVEEHMLHMLRDGKKLRRRLTKQSRKVMGRD